MNVQIRRSLDRDTDEILYSLVAGTGFNNIKSKVALVETCLQDHLIIVTIVSSSDQRLRVI